MSNVKKRREKKAEELEKKKKKIKKKHPDAKIREKFKELFKADRIVVPEKAKEIAKKEEKEIKGRLRGYKVEKDGEKIVVLIPRFKEEYSLARRSTSVRKTPEFREETSMRQQTFIADSSVEEKLKQISEGELVGTAHTHPSIENLPDKAKKEMEKKDRSLEELSESDKSAQVETANSPELVVSEEGASIGIPGEFKDKTSPGYGKQDQEKLKEKKVEYVSKSEIKEMLESESIPERRAKKKGLPIRKRKKKSLFEKLNPFK